MIDAYFAVKRSIYHSFDDVIKTTIKNSCTLDTVYNAKRASDDVLLFIFRNHPWCYDLYEYNIEEPAIAIDKAISNLKPSDYAYVTIDPTQPHLIKVLGSMEEHNLSINTRVLFIS